ncbi:MAG: glycoside hydrolase family 16 protein [Methylotetracoccus sp.]
MTTISRLTHSTIGSLSLAAVAALSLTLPHSADAGWKKTFADEFSGTAVDRAVWQTKDGFGTETYSGGGVQEAQCYEDSATSTSNGNLVLTATKKTFTSCAAAIDLSAIQYSSGRVTSYGKFSQTYGYFEARMKIPAGAGFWPAFWLLQTDNAWPPEIDIMEWVGKDPYKVYHTFHWNEGGHQAKGTSASASVPWSQDWHTYGVDWQPGLIVWYVDGKETGRVANSFVPNKPMYILVNLALGGGWGGWVDNNVIPNQMLVDYVRAFARVNDGTSDAVPPFGTVAPPVVPKVQPSLQMSLADDRSNPVSLQGATPTNPIYVFAKTDDSASRVEFWLDEANPSSPSSAPRKTENLGPYDFVGTDTDGTAMPFDINALGAGTHTISARVTLQDGTVQPVVASSFTINRTNVYVSTSSSRSNPRLLEGYSVGSNTSIYVFTSAESTTARISFWLDDPNPANPSGNPVKIENAAPFDLAGTASNMTALPFNTSWVGKGTHRLTVRATRADGTSLPPVTATFYRW